LWHRSTFIPALSVCVNKTAAPWMPPTIFQCKEPKGEVKPAPVPSPKCKDFKDEAGCEGADCAWCG
jgi:hypothetical protein